jgi:hypothetical protein
MTDDKPQPTADAECEHVWQYGDGRNAGSAMCTKCRRWTPAWIIAFDLQKAIEASRAECARLTGELDDAKRPFDELEERQLACLAKEAERTP